MALSEEDLKQVGGYVQAHIMEWLPANVIDISERVTRLDERVVRIDERIEKQQALMQQGFEHMERRFEQVDKRFEQVDKRFEQVDKRFDDMHRHSNRWMTVLTIMVGLVGVAVTVTNLMG